MPNRCCVNYTAVASTPRYRFVDDDSDCIVLYTLQLLLGGVSLLLWKGQRPLPNFCAHSVLTTLLPGRRCRLSVLVGTGPGELVTSCYVGSLLPPLGREPQIGRDIAPGQSNASNDPSLWEGSKFG